MPACRTLVRPGSSFMVVGLPHFSVNSTHAMMACLDLSLASLPISAAATEVARSKQVRTAAMSIETVWYETNLVHVSRLLTNVDAISIYLIEIIYELSIICYSL